MRMCYRFFPAVLAALLVLSCGSDPEPQVPRQTARQVPDQAESPPASVSPEVRAPDVAGPDPEPESFDPASITQEEFNTTKSEVQQLIQRLNGIIKAKNYTVWVSYLDSGYFRLISSREYLDRINRTDRMRKANIVLYNARDYFNNVVVPSRANDRVDDIEFVSPNRVKAYTVSQRGERLRLYDLEKADENWKIIN
ncbi:MAG: hypothetical protein LBI67_02875 [Treponema sp.]|nr:hypothetical protein [Treponema sp.]